MKLVKLPRYVRHGAYRGANPVNGSPAVHAMRRGPEIVVDVNAFLYAYSVHSDAFYPDEPGGTGGDELVSAWFAKGSACIDIETKASELARVLGRSSLPGEWICR
jgi:hypothetical protein